MPQAGGDYSQAETRFGKAALPENLAERLATGTRQQLDELAKAVIEAHNLESWLALLPPNDE